MFPGAKLARHTTKRRTIDLHCVWIKKNVAGDAKLMARLAIVTYQ
jgi:hypothetical protein